MVFNFQRVAASTILAGTLLPIALKATTSFDPVPPSDMPKDAQLVRTGYNISTNEPIGQWVACEFHRGSQYNFCRITTYQGTVVYQGRFLPLGASQPVPAERLVLAPIDPHHFWTISSGSGPVPLIPLVDGRYLVPASENELLAEELQRDPEWQKTALAATPAASLRR